MENVANFAKKSIAETINFAKKNLFNSLLWELSIISWIMSLIISLPSLNVYLEKFAKIPFFRENIAFLMKQIKAKFCFYKVSIFCSFSCWLVLSYSLKNLNKIEFVQRDLDCLTLVPPLVEYWEPGEEQRACLEL